MTPDFEVTEISGRGYKCQKIVGRSGVVLEPHYCFQKKNISSTTFRWSQKAAKMAENPEVSILGPPKSSR